MMVWILCWAKLISSIKIVKADNEFVLYSFYGGAELGNLFIRKFLEGSSAVTEIGRVG
jgi:hypothetical protein